MAVRRRHLPAPLALGAIFALTGLANAPPATVLRHLTFDVRFDSTSKVESRVSGFNESLYEGLPSTALRSVGGSIGTGSEESGSAAIAGPTVQRSGTIAIDVVAATGDGGLAVDVSESDGRRSSPPVRVGITDQNLYYTADAGLTDEEVVLLHYLARDLVKPTTLASGTTWVDDTRAGSTVEHVAYTVRSVDDGAKTIDADIAGTSSGHGTGNYTATTTGSMSYDLGKLVPTRLDLVTRTTMDQGNHVVRVESNVQATLRDDSFAKHG